MKLPLDCLGNIIEFMEDSNLLLSILCTCKMIKSFIEYRRPSCCKNILFHITNNLPDRKYVAKVCILNKIYGISNLQNIKYMADKSNSLNDKHIKQIKNLNVLRINYGQRYCASFQSLIHLKELYIRVLTSETVISKLNHLRNLEVLTYGKIQDTPTLYHHNIKDLTKLKTLIAPTLIAYEDYWPNKHHITHLELYCVYGSTSMFKDMTKLRYLHIESLQSSAPDHVFKNLSHVKMIILDDAPFITLGTLSKSTQYLSIYNSPMITYDDIRKIKHKCTIEICNSTIKFNKLSKLMFKPYITVTLSPDILSEDVNISIREEHDKEKKFKGLTTQYIKTPI
jgi:hypothetical protein